MSNGTDHGRTIAELVRQYDDRIERLRPCLTQRIPELRARCKDEMSSLIINREAIRRGLVQVPNLQDYC